MCLFTQYYLFLLLIYSFGSLKFQKSLLNVIYVFAFKLRTM